MAQPNVFITCKEARIENNRSFYGCFNIGPFDSTESLTVANALRRTLLSECPGLGIVSVMIENVKHEYSTIPGMRESVLDLVLNLKEIVFKKRTHNYGLYKTNTTVYNQIGDSYFKPVSGFLKVKGPGVVRAKDLKLPPFLECVDPEQYVATLANDGFLCMKFVIMEGKGYLVPKQSKKSNTSDFSSENFIDNNLVKKRLAFLKELKNSVKNENYNEVASYLLDVDNTKLNSKNSQKTNQISVFEDKKLRSSIKDKKGTVKNSTSLNLDTVFNPITKVSYMIEDFDNKIVNDLNNKVNFVNDISNLIESSHYLKNHMPFLTEDISLNQQAISKFVDDFSTSEISKLSSYLHPLKKQNPLHNIVLEIWTNGSLHPRDALYLAFDKLSSAFLNMKKTKDYALIIGNEASLLLEAQRTLVRNDLSPLLSNLQNEKAQLDKSSNEHITINNAGVAGSNIIGANNSLQLNLNFNSNLGQNKEQGIEFLNLPLRPYTLLKRSNINKISELCDLSINDLKRICGFNPKYVANIVDSLYLVNYSSK